nr:tRNA splicing endonuclease subunit sen2 [Polyrhizophydium stewartii]
MSHSSSGLKVRAATDRAGGATLPLALPTTDAVTLLHGYGLRRALGRLLRRAAQFLSFVAALLGLPRLAPRPAFRGVLEPELGFVLVEHHDRRSNASREAPRGVLGSPLSLWRSGFFGKGSLSRGEPTWWLRHHITSEQAAQMSSQDLHQAGAASERRAHARAVERAEIVAQVSEDPEVYRLMLEEAVFLACAVGCLRVHQETALSRDELWRRCREIRRQQSAATETRRPLDFALKYAAYHYYRSRGWVVKSGHLFGADFGEPDLGLKKRAAAPR